MAQTKRSLAQIYTLLADNSTGAISETDLRDAIATIQMGMGEISITSSAETSIASSDTWYPAAGTWGLTSGAVDWDMNTNGQLRYTGTPDRMVHIAISFSVTSAGSNKTYSFGVAKNGSILTPSIQSRKIATGTDIGTGALHALTDMSTNDYLTIVVRGDTDTTNATLDLANLFATDMGK